MNDPMHDSRQFVLFFQILNETIPILFFRVADGELRATYGPSSIVDANEIR